MTGNEEYKFLLNRSFLATARSAVAFALQIQTYIDIRVWHQPFVSQSFDLDRKGKKGEEERKIYFFGGEGTVSLMVVTHTHAYERCIHMYM